MRIFNFSSASWSRPGRGTGHSPDIICPLPQDKMTSFLTDTSRPALCLLLGPFPPLSHCTTATAVASCLTSIPLLQLSCPFLSTASGKLFIFFFLHTWDHFYLPGPLPFHPRFPQTLPTRVPAIFLLLAAPHLCGVWCLNLGAGFRLRLSAASRVGG